MTRISKKILQDRDDSLKRFANRDSDKYIRRAISSRGHYTHKQNVDYVSRKYGISKIEADRIVLSTDFGNE